MALSGMELLAEMILLEEEIRDFNWHEPDTIRRELIFQRCANVPMNSLIPILVRWIPPDELSNTIRALSLHFPPKNPPERGPSKPVPEGEPTKE